MSSKFGLPSRIVTETSPPSASLPNSSSSARGCLICFLDQAAHRTRAIEAIVALVRQPCPRILVELDVDILLGELELELEDELVDHAGDRVLAEITEGHDRIEAIAEFGRKHLLHRFFAGGMRLLDLVEQQHAMRVLVDRIGQQPALVEPT